MLEKGGELSSWNPFDGSQMLRVSAAQLPDKEEGIAQEGTSTAVHKRTCFLQRTKTYCGHGFRFAGVAEIDITHACSSADRMFSSFPGT